MDRNYEELRTEVMELDRVSQRKLANEIEEQLSHSDDLEDGFLEAKRRLDAVERGEMQTVDGPEALARVRKLIGR